MKHPTAYRLHQRLFQVLATESEPSEVGALTAQEAADLMYGYCEWAVCDPGPDGKPMTFAAYHAAVYGAESVYAGKGRKRA